MSDWCFSPVIDTSKASIHRLYTQTRTFLLKTSPSLTLTPLLVTDLTYLHSKLFHQLRTLTDLSYVHVAGGRCVVVPRWRGNIGAASRPSVLRGRAMRAARGSTAPPRSACAHAPAARSTCTGEEEGYSAENQRPGIRGRE
jgi:hypothetical protein